ncbi:MAG: DNA alkylation repair protein [Lachnospiraceae bacterium]|nr:DNA alkylation repair protein [Lachnospiraceae bacterium]
MYKKLSELQDLKYRELQIKIIPDKDPETIIGVRTPELKKIAGSMYRSGEYEAFIRKLPHKYFEEDQLHAFILSEIKDFDECMYEVERFLPYVDNWATCDQMSPKVFRKGKKELLKHIKKWIGSDRTYTVRFGIGMLMQHFLDEDYDEKYPKMVALVRSEQYYVNMMIAWYFATALSKQYESVLPYITEKKLDDWTHNKAIQKSVESYRISDEQKKYLKNFKVKIPRKK